MGKGRDQRIPILSLFSGGGFLDMAFESAGFEVVFSNELDPDFSRFYSEGLSSFFNEKKDVSFIGDVRHIDKIQLQSTIQNNVFGIIGGPPCQDFSIRGKKDGLDGLRGTMTYQFYEFILDLNPSFFLMENVPGLVMLNKSKDAFKSILELFNEEYHIDYRILNSLDFGVPQSRERLFVVGINRRFVSGRNLSINASGTWFNWPRPIFTNTKETYQWGEPLSKGSNSGKPIPPPELCVSSIILKDNFDEVPNGNEFFKIKNCNKISEIEEGDTYRPSFKRLHRMKYSPTACYGNNEVHLHPIENRRISVREALRIQGIPDSYVLSTSGKLSKKFKMIGNGVPYNLGLAIARSILNFLETVKSKDL